MSKDSVDLVHARLSDDMSAALAVGDTIDRAGTVTRVLSAAGADAVGITLRDTSVSGGGFQSDVSVTENGLSVYAAADVSGVLKSADGGLRFESANFGLQSTKVASLAITPDNEDILYAATGDKGTSGGLFRSVDGGNTWSLTGAGDKARFSGNHTAKDDPLPKGHPRSNGDLIVVDHGQNQATFTDDLVIAGTYKDGVRFLGQGGDSELSAVNTSGFVRSVAYNSALPNIAFAAIQFSDTSRNGIYRIDYSNIRNPASTLEYATLRPEGLAVLGNGHVYAAIGSGGIVRYDGTSWVLKNAGLAVNDENRQWTAVAGYVIGDDDVVYAGTNNMGGNARGSNYSTIWRSVNSGDTWLSLVQADNNVVDTVYGQPDEWWFRVDAFPQAGLGRKNSVVSSIALARGSSMELVSDDIIFVSGRGGIWKSDNGGGSWQPAVNNMQVTANNGVAVNPNDPRQLVLANTDYVVLETRSGFENGDVSRDKPDGAESKAFDVVFDTVSNEIIVGVGDRDKNDPGAGEVFLKSAKALGAPSGSGWTNTRLTAATSAGDGRVRAVTFGYHDGTDTTSQTILAAVEGEGVYRYHKGVWSKSNGVNIGSTDRSNFVWPDSENSGVVFLLDLSSGLNRSSDGGQTWINIWPSMSFRNNDFYNTGYIAAHDSQPSTLYVSIQGDRGSPIGTNFRVFRLTEADNRIFGEPGSTGITDITKVSGGSPIRRPGPLAFSPRGGLWLTQQQDSRNSVDAGLFVMEDPATDAAFMDVTTQQYRKAAVSPSGLVIAADGFVYISQNGIGLVKLSIPCQFADGC